MAQIGFPGSIWSIPEESFTLPSETHRYLLLCTLSLLSVSEISGFYPGSAGFKILSSVCFLAGGISLASIDAAQFQIAIIVGLASSLIGDVLLIPLRKDYIRSHHDHSPRPTTTPPNGPGLRFKAGMGFFALAHVAYIISFLSRDAGTQNLRSSSFLLTFLPGILLSSFLGLLGTSHIFTGPKLSVITVPADMTWAVRGYVVIIAGMVATAAATDSAWQRTVGAVMFAVSDVFVALDTFARGAGGDLKGWRVRVLGWWLYFWAQMLLAGCVAIGSS